MSNMFLGAALHLLQISEEDTVVHIRVQPQTPLPPVGIDVINNHLRFIYYISKPAKQQPEQLKLYL